MLRPLYCTGLVGLWLTVAQLPGASPWGPLEPGGDVERAARARASASRLYRLDLGSLRLQLKEAPRAGTALRGAVVLLPAPDGSLVRFAVEETAILHPDLQARFPHLRTYTARGVDDTTATAQLDDTDFGIRAQVISRLGRWYLDPLPEAGADVYQVVARRHGLRARGNDWKCHVSALSERAMFLDLRARALPLPQAASVGESLRTFRVAIAATGEYTRAAGGTVSAALSQITTALNRVAGIYQSELSISFQLVANNHLIVYPNPANDPYSGELSDLLDQNQANLDSVIGSSNYDFGHVFTTSGGGLAQLEAVCDPLAKAQGGTGLADPFGDIFYQDYVAHEFGHQFGARHSFNSDAGQCNANRDGSSAYEPGSGSTIMAYPGLCLDSNIQEHSDPYFHAASLLQVGSFLTTVFCGTSTPTGNRPPVLALRSYVVPYMAPFELPASGYDPDGDPLLWTFDQFDLGRSASHLGQDTSSGPQFRSRPPAASPVRSFPEVRSLISNQPNPGEVVLINTFAYADGPPLRALNFRVAARDGRGGVTIGSSQVLMHPRRNEQAPAFRVTNPSGFGLTFPGGTAFTLRWNVGNSRTDGIDTATVSIRLSADNGVSFPYLLAAEVPNNGEAVVMLPQLDSSGVRFKISAVGNIFYALSAAFTVTASAPTPAPLPTPLPTPTPTVGPTPTPLPTPTATPTRTPTPTVPGVTVFPTATPTLASRLVNVSTRLRVETGDSVAIAGFVLQGTSPRRVLVRALGPSLAAFGIVSPLADPSLELVTDGTTVATNDSWLATQRSVIQATGFAPANDAEAAIVATLPPGAHTAILRGTGGTTGVGIIEVYELDGPGGGARLINLSTRGQVLTGQNVMIGGFVIEGVSTVAKRRVLIRALGPSLAAFGIAGVLPDPVLTLKDAAGVTVAENDDWDYPDGQNAVLAGLAPLRALDSTIVTTLSPGAYTATVTGFEGVTGVSLIEVYELP